MQITIDTTEPISDLDRSLLSLLVGGELIVAENGPELVEPPHGTKVQTKPAPAKKAAAKKPEPTPEPIAEEPVEEEEPEDEPEGDADETSDEDLLELAVKKATEMVAGGEATKVREALDAAGASRVRELNTGNVREFFKALS